MTSVEPVRVEFEKFLKRKAEEPSQTSSSNLVSKGDAAVVAQSSEIRQESDQKQVIVGQMVGILDTIGVMDESKPLLAQFEERVGLLTEWRNRLGDQKVKEWSYRMEHQ